MRSWVLAFFAVITALSPLPASAVGGRDDCSPVRLDRNGGPLEQVPEPVQYAISICHAFAAAQLMDAYRVSHGGLGPSGQLTSALDVAIGVDLARGRGTVEMGRVCDAVNALKRRGSCDARPFEGSFARTFGDYPTDVETEREHRAVLGDLLEIRGEHAAAAIRRDEAAKEESLSKLIIRLYELDPKGAFTPTELRDVQRALGARGRTAFLDRAVNFACQDPRARVAVPQVACAFNGYVAGPGDPLGTPAGKLVREHGPQGWVKYINARLGRKGDVQPIAVGMCYNMIRFDPKYQGVSFGPGGPELKKGCLVHFPLVIGRRKTGDRCEFLLRNFRGTKCNWPYAKPWECEPDGGLWVDASALARNIHSVYEIGTAEELGF